MYDIDRCTVLRVQVIFFRDDTPESEIILPLGDLLLSFSFLFWIKILETFYLSAIINAGLLRDLTLGVSHDNYRK